MSTYVSITRPLSSAERRIALQCASLPFRSRRWQHQRRHLSAEAVATTPAEDVQSPPINVNRYDHLNPKVPDFSSTPFTDACTLNISSGGGGHGCVSFLREKFIAHGPPNGGDGGTGGNVFIQAVRGETSLHKIARRRTVRAGRGKNGEGGGRGGKRGDDVIITVPVGTVIREINRKDPVAEELAGRRGRSTSSDSDADDTSLMLQRDKWLLYPGALSRNFTTADFPPLPRPRRSNLAAAAVSAPITLDLDRPMSTPLLLAPGAVGGLGNPHFLTKTINRPKYATKGDAGMSINLQLELKLLADVGLVGLPNAGKSTLIRAVTSSRARVGSWAFTTLAPNIGTVVLDTSSGPASQTRKLVDSMTGELRTHFTIADIPGLIEDAHLDKGLGLEFLRHIERAAVLAFVVDLNAGDAVKALKGLWTELMQYDKLKNAEEESEPVDMERYMPFDFDADADGKPPLPSLVLPPISIKPWLVVATKADLPETRDNYAQLRDYLKRVQQAEESHPSGDAAGWRDQLVAIPVCAMKKENTDGVIDGLVSLLGRTSRDEVGKT